MVLDNETGMSRWCDQSELLGASEGRQVASALAADGTPQVVRELVCRGAVRGGADGYGNGGGGGHVMMVQGGMRSHDGGGVGAGGAETR